MKLTRIAAPLMAVALMSSAPFFALAQNNSNTVDAKAAAQDWNTPPAGTEQAQQGYRDGIQAAQLDKLAKRKIDAKASHLYVHPPASVKGDSAKDAYRNSFEAGYNAALKHSAS